MAILLDALLFGMFWFSWLSERLPLYFTLAWHQLSVTDFFTWKDHVMINLAQNYYYFSSSILSAQGGHSHIIC
jgi:hypothetical protein